MLEVRYIYEVAGEPVNEYTISNGRYQLSAINIGAAITKMIVPNQDDKLENITLRYYDYKDYKINRYNLGNLIDLNQFIKNEPCSLNYYFHCTFESNTLKFTYEEDDHYIFVKYSLLDNLVIIEYDTNLDIHLANVLFFNLSGNLKDNVLAHDIKINSLSVDLKEDIPFFKCYTSYQAYELLQLHLKDNGIHLNIDSSNRDIYVSFGKYFNEEFFINKKNLAQTYSGVGIVVCGKEQNQYVSYEFSEKYNTL